MNCFVTGGTGFIGSHTVVMLLEAGHEVTIFDNLSNSSIDVLDRIETITSKRPDFIEGDLRDEKNLELIFQEKHYDSVLHFAGLKSVGESVANPLEYYTVNVTGTLNLLRAMRAANCKRLVFSSSATVYGANNTSPMVEEMPRSATNPYGATKKMIEDILFDLVVSDSTWSIALLRYFNPIGAHPSGLLGESPKGIPNNLLPYIAMVANKELKELSVFGNDYDTEDGTGVRDYIHVMDLSAGHLKALEKLEKSTGVEAYNLGTGKGYSVLEMVTAFEKASGKKVPYAIKDRRPGDIGVCYADATKAFKELGWQAKYDLDTMCRDHWNYIKTKNNNKNK